MALLGVLVLSLLAILGPLRILILGLAMMSASVAFPESMPVYGVRPFVAMTEPGS